MPRGRPRHPDLLTPREQEVLDLLRLGLTNQQIAGRLGISLYGARYHVSEILSKLGVSSRDEAAAWRAEAAPERRRPLGLALPSLSLIGKGLAATAIGGVAIGLVLLLAGLVSMNARGETGFSLGGLPSDLSLGKLAYVQHGDIWSVQLPPDGRPAQLTDDGDYLAPRWSSSGEWLAALRLPDGDGDRETWVMRANGTAARRVDAGPEGVLWSPAEDLMAYVAPQGGLVIERSDGSDSRVLVEAPDGADTLSDPLWSPDGRAIAFARWSRRDTLYSGIWRVDIESGASVELDGALTPPGATQEAAGQMQPAAWSGDGRYVYYWRALVFSASIAADGLPLWVVSSEGGDARDLGIYTLAYHDYVQASRSSDQALVIEGNNRESWTNKRLAQVGPAGVEAYLTEAGEAPLSPAWSPDGSRIAYAAAPDIGRVGGGDPARDGMAKRHLWWMNADGTAKRAVTAYPEYRDEVPQWSRAGRYEGRYLVFARIDLDGNASVWFMPAGPRTGAIELAELSGPTGANDGALNFGYYGHVRWEDYFDWWQP